MRLYLLLLICATCSVVVDHNPNDTANRAFKFKNVPSPVKDDAAANAKLTLIDGQIDAGSAELSALVDGRLPTDEDEPAANLFFSAGSSGGRFRIDLGRTTEIAQINSYSWHPNSRGPQLYKLYAADDYESLDLNPKRGVDPATRGWKFIATVSTLPQQGEDGGQYGVSHRQCRGSTRWHAPRQVLDPMLYDDEPR